MLEIEKPGDEFVFVLEMQGDGAMVAKKCLANSEECVFQEITHAEATQVARWNLIVKELEFAEAQIIELLGRWLEVKIVALDRRDKEGIIRKALFDSAIISYTKCFNAAQGRRVKLEYRDSFGCENGKKFAAHHSEIKTLRDEYIAHAGNNRFENAKAFAVVVPSPRAGVSPKCVVMHTAFRMPDYNYTQKTLELIQFVKSKVSQNLQDKLDQLVHKVTNDPARYGCRASLQSKNVCFAVQSKLGMLGLVHANSGRSNRRACFTNVIGHVVCSSARVSTIARRKFRASCKPMT